MLTAPLTGLARRLIRHPDRQVFPSGPRRCTYTQAARLRCRRAGRRWAFANYGWCSPTISGHRSARSQSSRGGTRARPAEPVVGAQFGCPFKPPEDHGCWICGSHPLGTDPHRPGANLLPLNRSVAWADDTWHDDGPQADVVASGIFDERDADRNALVVNHVPQQEGRGPRLFLPYFLLGLPASRPATSSTGGWSCSTSSTRDGSCRP